MPGNGVEMLAQYTHPGELMAQHTLPPFEGGRCALQDPLAQCELSPQEPPGPVCGAAVGVLDTGARVGKDVVGAGVGESCWHVP